MIIVTGRFKWVEAVFDRHLDAAGRVRVILESADPPLAVEMDESALRRVV